MGPHSEGERVATSINQTENLLFMTMLGIVAVITTLMTGPLLKRLLAVGLEA
jgi:hypothetical protein